jgi:hypothetical protein
VGRHARRRRHAIVIGVDSINDRASTGAFTFGSPGFTGNSLADLLLGYPQATSGGVPLNTAGEF